MTEYWGVGGTIYFFLLTLYNFKKYIGGGEGGPTPQSLNKYTVEPRYNEVPRDRKNYFVISGFCNKRNPDIVTLPK